MTRKYPERIFLAPVRYQNAEEKARNKDLVDKMPDRYLDLLKKHPDLDKFLKMTPWELHFVQDEIIEKIQELYHPDLKAFDNFDRLTSGKSFSYAPSTIEYDTLPIIIKALRKISKSKAPTHIDMTALEKAIQETAREQKPIKVLNTYLMKEEEFDWPLLDLERLTADRPYAGTNQLKPNTLKTILDKYNENASAPFQTVPGLLEMLGEQLVGAPSNRVRRARGHQLVEEGIKFIFKKLKRESEIAKSNSERKQPLNADKGVNKKAEQLFQNLDLEFKKVSKDARDYFLGGGNVRFWEARRLQARSYGPMIREAAQAYNRALEATFPSRTAKELKEQSNLSYRAEALGLPSNFNRDGGLLIENDYEDFNSLIQKAYNVYLNSRKQKTGQLKADCTATNPKTQREITVYNRKKPKTTQTIEYAVVRGKRVDVNRRGPGDCVIK